ncbi:MAG: hypothetical protein GY710_01215 [Desulfobacteraceae bacterium]|nr:hypothetical protein [Desulfobacteraceae bacterium]
MKKQVLLILISLFIVLSGNAAYSYSIDWSYIQHRSYADGTEFNKASFAVMDAGGVCVMDDVIASAKLYDPDGIEVKIDMNFNNAYNTIYGGYNGYSSQWEYNYESRDESWYSSVFDDPLKSGTYHFVITDIDGNTYDSYKDFGSAEKLPVIRSDSFHAYKDNLGNFILTWEVPAYISTRLSTSVKVNIFALDDGTYKNADNISIRVPTHVGRVFVPGNIFQKLEAVGNGLKLYVQVRTNDNYNRTYSNEVILNLSDLPLLPADGPEITMTSTLDSENVVNPGWIKISGEVFNKNGTGLCAMILANGQHMFTCGDNQGVYELEVPLDANGEITLFGFCDGLLPFKKIITP